MLSKDNIRFIVQTPTAESFELSFKIAKTIKQLRDAIKQKHKNINPSFKIISDGKLIEDEDSKQYIPHQNQRYLHQSRRAASHQL